MPFPIFSLAEKEIPDMSLTRAIMRKKGKTKADLIQALTRFLISDLLSHFLALYDIYKRIWKFRLKA